MKEFKKKFFALIGLSFGLTLPINATLADEDVTSGFKQYAAEWEQWAWTIPTAVNPLLDTTGASCMISQRGPVWFLAGFAGEGKATRSCSIPEGKWLFFPIANSVNSNSPGVCGQKGSLSLTELRKSVADQINGIKKPSALVDGKPVKYLKRVQADVFALAVPEENPFDAFCGKGGLPAGVYSPAVDDGYYAAVEPLKIGKHTIVIHAEGGFTQDITYNLTIVPVKQK